MRKGNIAGIILIMVGIAWIIQQTGIISVNWVSSIKVLWPVILVAIGVSILVGHRKRLIWGVWVLTFMLLFGYGIYKNNDSDRILIIKNNLRFSEIEKQPVTDEIPLAQGTTEGGLILNLGAVNLKLSEGRDDLLVKVQSNITNLEQRLAEGEKTVLEYSYEQLNVGNTVRNFDIQMNPGLLWEVDTSMGAIDGKLDFTGIPLSRIALKLGAGSLDVVIGNQQADTTMELHTGVASLNIYVPEGAGLKVKSRRLLSELSFDNINMVKEDDIFLSENYDISDQKIEMDIQAALSSIHVFKK